MKYAFGVDVGGTTVKLGLFSGEGELLEKWEIPTRTEQGGQAILPDIVSSLRERLDLRDIAPAAVAGIGIAVPGPVDEDGIVHGCVNLGWGDVDVKSAMNHLLPEIPAVSVGNDANAATLGEVWKGGGAGHDSAVMFTLGTGVGGGVVVNNRVIAGTHGAAGELGHMTVEPAETIPCACGKCGCLEQYASANGIVRMGQVMLSQCSTPSPLRNMESFTSKDICDLAREGDPMACSILDRFGEYLGRAMSLTAAVSDPDIFIIGGGMSRAGRVILDAIEKHYRRYAFYASASTSIVTAELGNDAGIYGCAKMALS